MTDNDNEKLSYAGDLSPKQVWQRLVDDPHAVLIDVRTPEEWAYVGVPDLAGLDRDVCFVPWLFYPRMNPNPDFVEQIKKETLAKSDTPLLFICRSGVRSVYAADALAQAGFSACYNVSDGFEGDPDDNNHRGCINGWKVDGLAWEQG